MAEKKAKTAEKNAKALQFKHLCRECGGESKVTKFAGFGRKGFYLVCEKNNAHVGPLH